jgi:L-ascorbate metabolism protein UlaG (beta-lactamase superfamily)
MDVRWLGWAGVEIEAQGATLVVDPLADAAAVFAPLGDEARGTELPRVVEPDGHAVAGLVSHLHRDHADAGALARALAGDGAVYEPIAASGAELENLGLAQAEAELRRAGLKRRAVSEWETVEVGPFLLTALPAVDGTGDPQVSWLVEADGVRVLHLGDTIFHAYWWRIAQRHGPFDVVFAPINGAVVDFPHRQPPSPLAAVMDPEQAALAGELLGAATIVPMHYGGFDIDPWYRPVADPLLRFQAAAAGRPYESLVLEPGESIDLAGAGIQSARFPG